MCVYVCVYVYVCGNPYVRRACIASVARARFYLFLYACVCVSVCVCVYICVRVCICVYVSVFLNYATYIYIFILREREREREREIAIIFINALNSKCYCHRRRSLILLTYLLQPCVTKKHRLQKQKLGPSS